MVPDRQKVRTDGRRQNYIPPTSSGDYKKMNVNQLHTRIWRRGSEVIKLFSYLTQLSTNVILLINGRMPIGILTFISMINTTSERLKVRNFFICWYFSFYEQLKFRAQLSQA